MPYLDTSVLVAALVNEARSDDADELLTRSATIWISDLTLTEAAAALSLKVRTRVLDEPGKRLANEQLGILVSHSLHLTGLVSADFRRAATFCRRSALGLRAGDALHLAIAERIDAELVTLDQRQAAAGPTLGIATRLL